LKQDFFEINAEVNAEIQNCKLDGFCLFDAGELFFISA
jgi:hypothetical protein